MARRSKASEARITALLAALRTGNTREAAAGHAEIDRTTLYRWMTADPALRARVEKAEADAEVRFEAQVAQGAATDWHAAAWWLERRRRTDYGRAAPLSAELVRLASQPLYSRHPIEDLPPAELAARMRIWADGLDVDAAELGGDLPKPGPVH